MKRRDLQALAKLRLREARILLDNRCYEGAYYLAGYAVERALKACIAKKAQRHDFPDRKRVNDSYSHDFDQLLRVADLKPAHEIELKMNTAFAQQWFTIKDWSEQARYKPVIQQADAEGLYQAITDRQNGVLSWLKKFW
jgi:HEPN domain-containing protein